jgi:tRNA threonylcarbamoyladenosine biosynthesis protein TsaB
MKILTVDTALGACSVAVTHGEKTLAHKFELMDRGHAEALAPMVEETMREAGIAFAQLDRLAVTTGPGTFTGQRVGLAFMRGLRVALKKPLTGVTTLEALCAAACAESGLANAAAVHDAKRGEAYLSIAIEGEPVAAPKLVLLEEAASIIAKVTGRKVAFAGTAAERVAQDFAALGCDAAITSIRQPDALWVARLALTSPASDKAPLPLYLRSPDAKLPAASA